MLGLSLPVEGRLRVLAIGAHADDIEIGCGGTLLELIAGRAELDVTWVVASASRVRACEAKDSASAFLLGAAANSVRVWDFRDGYLPFQAELVKDHFEALKLDVQPDLVLTHYRSDRHQDHRLISDLTWNTFRDAVVLEYEIPKWDGDLGTPNLYVELDEAVASEKVRLLHRHFPSQRGKDWFDDETFLSMMRIRGMECRSHSRLAEAFYARKVVLNTSNKQRECR